MSILKSGHPSLDLALLDADGSVIALLDANARIVWVNQEWVRFMRENSGERADELVARWGPGAVYLDGMSQDLRAYYARLFANVRETGKPYIEHYACSSSEMHREFRLRLLRLDPQLLLCEHTLVRQTSATDAGVDPDEEEFRRADGLISQCSNCRRVRRTDGRWQWVPSWVDASPADTSHGVCASCCAFYYPDYFKT